LINIIHGECECMHVTRPACPDTNRYYRQLIPRPALPRRSVIFHHALPLNFQNTSCPFSISQQHCLALALLFHLPPYLVPLQLTHRAYPVDAALDVRVLTPPPSFPLPRSITFAKSTQWTLWFLSFSTHGKSRFSPSSPNGISQS
jgi:hypothetical protein